MSGTVAQRTADLYDITVPDWPGEIDFYRHLAAQATADGRSVLEVACGTGRVTIRLAHDGAAITGLDLSPEMLDVARRKSRDLTNVRWVEADMRAFDLGRRFGLILIPGHSLQNLNSAGEQVAALRCIEQHLEEDGLLVVHLDHQNAGNMAWLGAISGERKGVFEAAGEVTDPATGHQIRLWQAWSYEPATQTAYSARKWEEVDDDGTVIDSWERPPIPLHCLFRFEMEHLLGRTSFTVEALYGDFQRRPLTDDSTEMIWLARKAQKREPS